MIFAREIGDRLTGLVKKLDEATGKNTECKMGSFVVFCSDDEALEKKLKELAEKEKLTHLVFVMEGAAGPVDYNVAKEADITVVLYVKHEVKANYAFKKGGMKEQDIDKIMGDLKKILPEKK
jgi:hypothetical protein